jgi:putative endonuclease
LSEEAPGDRRKRLGNLGERLAAGYLRRQGYLILETDWRCQAGQVDLIARDGEQLVFVEVKTRRSQRAGLPEEAVTRAKKERLIRLAESYRQSKPEGDLPESWRIDVVAIDVSGSGAIQRIELIKSAVEG